MMKEMELTLSEALSHAKVEALPAKAELGSNGWISAIALVRKANNRTNYAIVNNDGSGNPQVVRDFGAAFVIKEVLEIYPYRLRNEAATPHFESKDEIVEYLVRNGEKKEKIEELMSDTFKNGNPKPAGRVEGDRNKIKILVEKYSITNEVLKANELSIAEDVSGMNAKNGDSDGQDEF